MHPTHQTTSLLVAQPPTHACSTLNDHLHAPHQVAPAQMSIKHLLADQMPSAGALAATYSGAVTLLPIAGKSNRGAGSRTPQFAMPAKPWQLASPGATLANVPATALARCAVLLLAATASGLSICLMLPQLPSVSIACLSKSTCKSRCSLAAHLRLSFMCSWLAPKQLSPGQTC